MKISEIEKLQPESPDVLPSQERRTLLKIGLAVTGVYLGGKVLSLTSATNAFASGVVPRLGEYPYSPHYSMVIREHLCIDCELCMEACVETNDVPEYGYRTKILERRRDIIGGDQETIFMPVLCNHCNRPPCVRVCPTTATWKDKATGIVVMKNSRCIGCKTCMAACPYNARYFHEERRAVDKCNFCWDTRLSKGDTNTACAEACPADVRVFGDLSDPNSRVFSLLHTPETIVWVLRPESGALPNIYYINK
ncbi:MAG: 4Fe-4S dicluster domain-containing protein [Desulfofustis sp. PB-SRB1]|jgi:Fe-S-cluster-containing dehydrogenase component|nr:4Fe-4S dicluster domain-containing protein [Desulfofustis sp. PB-SRB1]MBM1001841.1 4Fe-4S dicluster domain-containing protein [Desulfofustis sp. PB-SRB1]HBH29706.1 4Fe-4S dicluster domain-containing protein [Desulfofustis sp.]HBH32640.1 4Fe-4S dicluster domain-containing protein [Desulfofustis sp.]